MANTSGLVEISSRSSRMSGTGSAKCNGGGLEALLKAAKFVEEQEKQKLRRQSGILRHNEESPEAKETAISVCHNGLQPLSSSSPSSSSNRIPTPPLPRHGSIIREVHNKLEKNRRAHLKECFETLKKQLPLSLDEKKTSNLSILHNAIRYINILKRKEREFEHEMERLAREKIAHQQRLATLKKELTAQWEHIDLNTLLPEIVEPQPRRTSDLVNGRMMDTGSEEDVVRTSTLYSSTSSLSSASPLHSDSVSHHTQLVSSPGPPSLLMSPIQQLLPSTTIRMLPADAHFVHSHIPTTGIAIQNGVINHSTVKLTTKHPVTESNTLVASGILNHPLVVPQPSGSFLLAAPHISDKVMSTAPVLKTIGQVPVPIQQQFLVKPTMVVVSAAANTSN